MPGGLQSPSEMEGTSYVGDGIGGGNGGNGGMRSLGDHTLRPHLASAANFRGGRRFREGCLPGALSSFVDQDTVSVGVVISSLVVVFSI